MSAANRAAEDHNRAGCGRPESHIGACATRPGPKSARSTARSCDTQVCAVERQFTTWVTPSARSLTSVAAVGMLPIASRSSPSQLSAVVNGLGP